MPGGDGPAGERVLRLESELRESRLELSRLEQLTGRLRAELARTRDAAEEDARLRTDADIRRLVTTISTPLVQLITQEHLHSTGAAPVRTGDVLDVAARLVRALREAEVDIVGEIGATEPFDPQRHDPLSAAAAPVAGQPVTVRVPGLSCRGHIVRKAGIDPAGAAMGAGGADAASADAGAESR